MKYIKKFNEAIVDWKSDNIENFYKEALKSLDSGKISKETLKEIGEKNDIEVVDYNTFLKELPSEKMKSDAPPKKTPLFALVNPKTHKIRVVINYEIATKRSLDYLYHMIKHENVHVGQMSRKKDKSKGEFMGDIKDTKAYFSNKDEIMAFSHSLVDLAINNPLFGKASSVKSGFEIVQNEMLWKHIKSSVDEKTLKRYKKYIYLYLKKEID